MAPPILIRQVCLEVIEKQQEKPKTGLGVSGRYIVA